MAVRELTIEKVQEATDTTTEDGVVYKLVLYNDDVNTFDWVIESLMKVCDHTQEQADQCAHIVHYKGKCTVKLGSLDYLLPRRRALEERSLSAVIES